MKLELDLGLGDVHAFEQCVVIAEGSLKVWMLIALLGKGNEDLHRPPHQRLRLSQAVGGLQLLRQVV